MSRKKVGIIITALIITGGCLGAVWATDLKIGYVDIQKAVNECNAGKEAKKALTKEAEKIQQQSIQKQKDLQQMKDSFEKQAPMLNLEARAAKEKDFQSKLRDFQRWAEDNQNEIKQKLAEIERNLSIGLQKVIQKVGADEGYTLIVEKNENIVLYVSKSIDLTERVIKVFDNQKK
jgi:outer membrane protein